MFHIDRLKLKQEMAELMKESRLKYGLSRKELAVLIGTTEATLGNWESGQVNAELIAALIALKINLELLSCNKVIGTYPKLARFHQEGLVDTGRRLMGTDNFIEPSKEGDNL